MKTRSQVLLLACALFSVVLLVFVNSGQRLENIVRIENINNIEWVQYGVGRGKVERNREENNEESLLVTNKCQGSSASLYPEENPGSDRVLEQLDYRPCGNSSKTKKILIWSGVGNWGGIKPKNGKEVFEREECPVSNCVLTSDKNDLAADLVIFKDGNGLPRFQKPHGQLWMIYLLESPLHVASSLNRFDWTATYRRDSTIVAPYFKWRYFDSAVISAPQMTNYADKKTKQVAWFVSNCNAKNKRLEYAEELQKYIGVDIYGTCGDKKCPRHSSDCKSMLSSDYKFYLSFENSNCRDYITEKFFNNALQHNIVPIVMGATLEDYNAVAPHGSFIHVDQFGSPKELATYLHKLNENDELYNQYFQWKGTGDFIKTKFFCRVCAMLHYHQEIEYVAPRTTQNLDTWWKGPDICENNRIQ